MTNTGLFSSIYGGVNHATQGIYNVLFNKDGSFSPVKRMDIRLGSLEEAVPASPFNDLFSRNYKGIPYWVLAVFGLGFAYSYRNQKKLRRR